MPLPQALSKEDLARLLRFAADHVEQNDSHGGSIVWDTPDDDARSGLLSVQAFVRFDNLEGQGCMRIVGLPDGKPD